MKLNNILITPLARIPTTGGDVLHAMKKCDVGFDTFGEAYFSWVETGMVKGWKCHTQMTMNIIVPVGQVRFVFFLKDTGEFRSEDIGNERYIRITIPPGIWFGFKGLSSQKSLVLNISNIEHDPNEVNRVELTEIKYDWS